MFPSSPVRHPPLVLLLALLVAACSTAPATAPDTPGGGANAVAEASATSPASPATAAGRASPTGRAGSGAFADRTGDELEAGGEPTPRPTRAAVPTAGAAVTPVPTATAPPTQSPPSAPIAVDLYRRGDFVPQYTFDWCVGASIQMMLNMIRDPNEGSRARQREIWNLARIRSNSRYGGANPVGWTAALGEVGAGEYRLVSVMGYAEALRTAARALRETGRPVGLVMWSGRHAWVMNGFTSLGDPALTAGFEVTGVRVLDPLYPHGSRVWGPSPRPNSLLSPDELAEQFVPRTGRRQPDYAVPGSYVLVLPVVS